jgi:hypothetical protein
MQQSDGNNKPALAKFNSTWITESIMAMQRPSDAHFDNGLLDQFVTNRIVAVFNLTEPGEHPFCGYGIIPATGFSYSPERLMNVGSTYKSTAMRGSSS